MLCTVEAQPRTNSKKLVNKKTFNGSNRTMRRSISIIVWNPCRNCLTELFPTLFLIAIGTYLIRLLDFKKAKVLVVEKEKPDGRRCMYFNRISFLKALNPEFKSGILVPARKFAYMLKIVLPGRRSKGL